jgi:hypothetical protein
VSLVLTGAQQEAAAAITDDAVNAGAGSGSPGTREGKPAKANTGWAFFVPFGRQPATDAGVAADAGTDTAADLPTPDDIAAQRRAAETLAEKVGTYRHRHRHSCTGPGPLLSIIDVPGMISSITCC